MMTLHRNRLFRIMVALFLAVGFVAAGGASRDAIAANSSVQIVNLSDQSFGAVWYTTTQQTGSSIKYGTSCAGATTSVAEVRSNGFVHLVDLPGGLNPHTLYYFVLVVGGVTDNNGGNCYQATTLNSQATPPPPSALYGAVETTSACNSAAKGALVMLTVKHGSTTSTPLAIVTDSNIAAWALPFADATDTTGAFITLAANDSIDLTAATDGTHNSTVVDSYDGTSLLIGPQTLCVGGTITPILTPSPTHAPAFARAQISGTGYQPGETVTVKWNCSASGCSSITTLGTPTADASGNWTVNFTVPDFSPGTYPIGAAGNTSHRFAKTNFTVSAPPVITPAPTHAPALAQANVSGTGFRANETVTVKWNCGNISCSSTNILLPGGKTTSSRVLSLGPISTDSSGNFTKTFAVPNFTPGTYPIGAIGSTSNSFAKVSFVVDVPATLSISPASGHPGSGYTVSGTGYRAGETVTVKFNCGAASCSSLQTLGSAVADSNGHFSLPVTIPNFSARSYPIGALGSSSTTFTTTTFTIN